MPNRRSNLRRVTLSALAGGVFTLGALTGWAVEAFRPQGSEFWRGQAFRHALDRAHYGLDDYEDES